MENNQNTGDKEKKNAIGPKKRESELEFFLGSPVRVGMISSNPSMGIVHKVSSEWLYLFPSFVNEGVYDKEGKVVNNYILNDKLPTLIKISSINYIEPVDKDYIPYFANISNFNTYPKSKLILTNSTI